MQVHMQIIIHLTGNFINGLCMLYFSKCEDGMQDNEETITSPDVLRPLVVRSLRRSNVRKRIADYLFEISPSGSYTSDIAYHVKTTPTNVIGAIRGMNSRYKDDESLLGLNIVEQIQSGKNIKIYRLSSFGKEMLISMKERE